MKRIAVVCVMSFALALSGVAAVPVGVGAKDHHGDHANMVITWNRIMMTTFAAGLVPAPVSTRLGAIVQASVFDAVNGIEPRYTSIHVAPAAPEDASPEAAAAGAAYSALVALFPTQKTTLDADLAASIATLNQHEDHSNTDIANGLAWGNAVAAQTVAWRATDGFNSVLPPYVPGTAPGDWQPTPGGSGDPKFRTLAITAPFAMTSPSQFRPGGPPALTSTKYTQDFNEVKAFGSAGSTVRSAFQTQTAQFWQLDTPIGIWDRVADSLAEEHHLSLLSSARLLALVDIAETDAAIAVWDAKNTFNSWRPVTAIAQAALDGNPATAADPTWSPLLVTPYFQEYPSGHSGVSSAATSVMASFFGNRASFTVTSDGLPGVTRSFNRFSDAVAQVADARVFAGFHFRFACDDATLMGKQVARYAQSTLMQRLGDRDD